MGKSLIGEVGLVTDESRGIGAAGVRADQGDAAPVDRPVKAVVQQHQSFEA
jgi:hypothetical protein